MQHNAINQTAPLRRVNFPSSSRFALFVTGVSALMLGGVVLLALASTSGMLKAALETNDAQLAAISQRAERLQMFARHIRKVSLPAEQDVQLPYAGVVASHRQIQPGSRLTLYDVGSQGRVFEVLGASKIDASFSLSAKPEHGGDLFLVSGRIVGAHPELDIQFLVTVNAPKSLNDSPPEQRSL